MRNFALIRIKIFYIQKSKLFFKKDWMPSGHQLSVSQSHPQMPSSAQQSGTNAPVHARSNRQDKSKAILPEPDR